jgi:hypothetical protein
MIKRWFAQLILNRVAAEIEKAAASEYYERCKFLCPVLGFRTMHPFKRAARLHIERILGGRPTLGWHIQVQLNDDGYVTETSDQFSRLGWNKRIVIHRAFYAKMVAELRKGNPDWGITINPKEIGITPDQVHSSAQLAEAA